MKVVITGANGGRLAATVGYNGGGAFVLCAEGEGFDPLPLSRQEVRLLVVSGHVTATWPQVGLKLKIELQP